MTVDIFKLSTLLTSLMGNKKAAEMAREMGVNAQTFRAYVRGDINTPSKEFLYEVAQYMDIDLDTLLKQISKDPSISLLKEGSVIYYLNASEAIPKLEKMPPQEQLKVAKYLLNNAI